jgi:hypothetical protein
MRHHCDLGSDSMAEVAFMCFGFEWQRPHITRVLGVLSSDEIARLTSRLKRVSETAGEPLAYRHGLTIIEAPPS